MASPLCLLTSETLGQLAGALRSGRLAPPLTPLMLRRYVPEALAAGVAAELQGRVDDGAQARHLADALDLLRQDRGHRPLAEDLIDLVWTGPEAPGVVNRDTSVVVREMFQGARESVLVAGYAVYQGQTVFRELAERIGQRPELRVRMFLDVRRPPNDASSPSELVRAFAERFVEREWPGDYLPEVYYDPRSLAAEPSSRASLHAKCVVVDDEQALVTSANFTEAAQTRNIEVGVYLRSSPFARRLAEQFEALAASHVLQPVPIVRRP